MGEVRLDAVAKSFGGTVVLQPTDLHIGNGEFVVLVGPSGSGKSTLLRLIAGLEEVSAGRIEIGGVDVTSRGPSDRGIAMVFQSYALYPHLSVYENMAFALKLAKLDRTEVDAAVRRAAAILDITPLLDRRPRQLSGGQRQRVAIGRAIVRQPKVFLFDEPLSNLDAALRVSMRYEFARLHDKLRTTMIYVTHDQVEAMTLADRIVVLANGRIEQVGTPLELYERPDTLFVAGFIGSPRINLIPVTIARPGAEVSRLSLPGNGAFEALIDTSRAPAGAPATLGLRPEQIRIGDGGNGFEARVRFVEDLGALTFAYLDMAVAEQALTVQLPGHQRLKAGETVRLTADPAAAYLFDAEGRAFARVGTADLAERRAVNL
ncbi:MAG TPA: sn-glycerol-3-phosphate ABC transporter ATP-binding protein UgpC [Allosphingosinicella sp.]|jgi:multiple sugar transport system ATP-binding protein